jgi:hypothetical protein
MNVLANSQMEKLKKFLKQSGLPDNLCPSFARYTGQDPAADREAIRLEKPDILLTNFMMLELLMTRQIGSGLTGFAEVEFSYRIWAFPNRRFDELIIGTNGGPIGTAKEINHEYASPCISDR